MSRNLSQQPLGRNGTLKKIEEDLIANFPEFRDQLEGVGARKLELVRQYLMIYFCDVLSPKRRERKGKVKKEEEDDKPNIVSARATVEPEVRRAFIEEVDDKIIASATQSISGGLKPSTAVPHDTFVHAGITNKKALDSIAAWPRPDLFGLFEDAYAAGHEKLSKVTVEV
ncbi:hypothetical protein B0H19DRAFT_1266033 [Mycena capillaripes]|nr:hypothetical protein B0H19DRAFT_1266033 [Mycena capillaripes]